MALLKGKATFVKFNAGDGLLLLGREGIESAIKRFAFQDIDDTYDEYSIGWVSVTDYLDSSFSESPVIGDYVVMSMRCDQRKVPAAILNKYLEKEIRATCERKGIPRLPRSIKKAIKERVKSELTRKAQPTPTVVDVVINIPTGTVFFFSGNKMAQAIFEDLFRETFGGLVAMEIPYRIALEEYGEQTVTNMNQEIFKPGDGMDLVDIMVMTQSVGQEFLAWLWWLEPQIEDQKENQIVVFSQPPIKLESADDKLVCSGKNRDSIEASMGLLYGKAVVSACFIISVNNADYMGTIDNFFTCRSITMPTVAPEEEDEGVFGLILERIALIEWFVSAVRSLFLEFVARRSAPNWASGDGKKIKELAKETVESQF